MTDTSESRVARLFRQDAIRERLREERRVKREAAYLAKKVEEAKKVEVIR